MPRKPGQVTRLTVTSKCTRMCKSHRTHFSAHVYNAMHRALEEGQSARKVAELVASLGGPDLSQQNVGTHRRNHMEVIDTGLRAGPTLDEPVRKQTRYEMILAEAMKPNLSTADRIRAFQYLDELEGGSDGPVAELMRVLQDPETWRIDFDKAYDDGLLEDGQALPTAYPAAAFEHLFPGHELPPQKPVILEEIEDGPSGYAEGEL